MGNQGHAKEGTRLMKEWVQAGAIGKIREAHIWTNRPIWPQGLERPVTEDPVPASLDCRSLARKKSGDPWESASEKCLPPSRDACSNIELGDKNVVARF